MAPSKYYSKIRSKFTPENEEKLLLGKLSNSANNPNLGYIDVYFEVLEGEVKTVRPSEYTDSADPRKAQVFIRGGYESYEKDYGYERFILFRAYITTQHVGEGGCKYTAVYSYNGEPQHFTLNKDCPFIAEISNTSFSDGAQLIDGTHNGYSVDSLGDDYFDTPHFFQIDISNKKVLGPLFKGEQNNELLHGQKVETQYDFWRSRKLEPYEAFIISYTGYENHIKETFINGKKRMFLINLGSFFIGKNGKPRNPDFQTVDLIPDQYLVNEFYKSAEKSSSIKPYPKSKIKEWLDNKSIKLSPERKKRISHILKDFEKFSNDKNSIFDLLLKSDEAEPLLKKFAEENEDQYLDRFRKKESDKVKKILQETELKKIEIIEQNDAVKAELSKNREILEKLSNEKNQLQREVNEKLRTALENIEESEEYKKQMSESTKQLSDINKKIEDAEKKYGNFSKLIDLDKKYKKIEKDVSYKESRQDELNSIIKGLNEKIDSGIANLANTYIEQKIIQEIQNGEYKTDKPQLADHQSSSIELTAKSDEKFRTGDYRLDRKEVIKAIRNRLEKMNRSIELSKIEASIIAIMQNQFVVLAGLPGTGKTSFAIQLAFAFGSKGSTLTVPVAKDWTRPKDLMGYYNPITSNYEPGVTGFYPFFKNLNKYKEELTSNSFMILDEFNLSQPEFYLSNLTVLADKSYNREINLGHNHSVLIPKTSRFICTANTDETVQSLSARMINRCAFIQFYEQPDLEATVNELEFDDNHPVILTGTEMVELFTASETDIISDSMIEQINKLVSAFRNSNEEYGNGIPITPRKYNQLLQFCKVMSSQDNNQSLVLDYAANFFLLPLVSGSGSLFKDRLEHIKDISDNFSMDAFSKNIEALITEGNSNFDQYRFMLS